MRWNAVLKDLKGDKGFVSPQNGQEIIVIPIEYLPKDCRVGDVLNFKVTFDPYSTLSLIKESQGKI